MCTVSLKYTVRSPVSGNLHNKTYSYSIGPLCNSLSLCVLAVLSCAISNGGCEQECVQLSQAHFQCRCRHNYQLTADGKHCKCKCPSLGFLYSSFLATAYCIRGRVIMNEAIHRKIFWCIIKTVQYHSWYYRGKEWYCFPFPIRKKNKKTKSGGFNSTIYSWYDTMFPQHHKTTP